jgi:hypothetical protein
MEMRKMASEKALPKIEDFLTEDGTELRALFVLAVMRALSPRERAAVLNSLASMIA